MKVLPAIAVSCLLLQVPGAAQPATTTLAEWTLGVSPEDAAPLSRSDSSRIVPLDEMTSKAAVLRMISEQLGIEVTDVPPNTDAARLLDALGDEAAVRRVVSSVTGIAEDVLFPSTSNNALPDSHALPPSLGPRGHYVTPETHSVDETLAKMSPEHAETMKAYVHLLDDDNPSLPAGVIVDMDRRQFAAYEEFLRENFKPPPPPQTPREMVEYIRQSLAQGWFESTEPARGGRMMREIDRLRVEDEAPLRRPSWAEPARETADESYSVNIRGQQFEVAPDSRLGGLLYVTASGADDVIFDDPNLRILGRDGSVITIRHPEGVWTTTVWGFDGSVMYEVSLESPERLEGAGRNEFVNEAVAMIEKMSKRHLEAHSRVEPDLPEGVVDSER